MNNRWKNIIIVLFAALMLIGSSFAVIVDMSHKNAAFGEPYVLEKQSVDTKNSLTNREKVEQNKDHEYSDFKREYNKQQDYSSYSGGSILINTPLAKRDELLTSHERYRADYEQQNKYKIAYFNMHGYNYRSSEEHTRREYY